MKGNRTMKTLTQTANNAASGKDAAPKPANQKTEKQLLAEAFRDRPANFPQYDNFF